MAYPDKRTEETLKKQVPTPNFANQADRIRGLQSRMHQDNKFSAGGIDGAQRLNDDPNLRQSVVQEKQLTRDFRLARREAIRRNDRAGAARIATKAGSMGLQISGIAKHGDMTRAAANSIISRNSDLLKQASDQDAGQDANQGDGDDSTAKTFGGMPSSISPVNGFGESTQLPTGDALAYNPMAGFSWFGPGGGYPASNLVDSLRLVQPRTPFKSSTLSLRVPPLSSGMRLG